MTRVSELAPGSMTWTVVEGVRVMVANVDGTFYALKDACGHRQAALSRGTLHGHAVECPLHYARFDVRTGRLLDGPTSTDIPTYEVVVEDGVIYVTR